MKRAIVVMLVLLLAFTSFVASVRAEDEYTLTIDVEGEGEVYPYGEGEHIISEGEEVELFASGDYGWSFVEWKGDIESEKKEINFTMDSDMQLTAVFKPSIEITNLENNQTVEGRDIEVKWVIRANDSEYTHVEVRLDDGSWQRVGDREAWMFYDTNEGNYSIEVRLVDSRTVIGEDRVDRVEFVRVDWYESMPVWETLILLIVISMLCGIDRLFKGININLGEKVKQKYKDWRS